MIVSYLTLIYTNSNPTSGCFTPWQNSLSLLWIDDFVFLPENTLLSVSTMAVAMNKNQVSLTVKSTTVNLWLGFCISSSRARQLRATQERVELFHHCRSASFCPLSWSMSLSLITSTLERVKIAWVMTQKQRANKGLGRSNIFLRCLAWKAYERFMSPVLLVRSPCILGTITPTNNSRLYMRKPKRALHDRI